MLFCIDIGLIFLTQSVIVIRQSWAYAFPDPSLIPPCSVLVYTGADSNRLQLNYQTVGCHLGSAYQRHQQEIRILEDREVKDFSPSSDFSAGGSDSKVSAYNTGDLASIPGSGRSPGGGNDNPLQYSCLENPMDRRTW